MDISKVNKILLLILLTVIVFWIFSGKKSKKCNTTEQFTQNNLTSNNFDDKIDNIETFDPESNFQNTTDNESSYSNNSGSIQDQNKIQTLSNNLNTESVSDPLDYNYKSASYSKGERGSKSNELDKFFEGCCPKNANNNNGFTPSVENGIGAAYTPGKPEKLSEKDKFDPDSLLPREKNSDWVDDPYEDVTVKSSTLGNIFRPVGINSVQSSKKISYHDMRGIPKAPKFNVSPWNNSSVDGDTNIRNESLCL